MLAPSPDVPLQPAFRMRTRRAELRRKGMKLLRNQLSQRIPLLSPMVFMVSLRRVSFSCTTPLMIMATE